MALKTVERRKNSKNVAKKTAFIKYKTADPKKTPLKSAEAKNTLKTRKPKNTDAKKKDA